VTDNDAEVLVLGAGVIGLTTAICLAEAGLTVAVVAAEPPQQTTSAAAGAIWGPHLVGRDDRIGRWAATTLRRLTEQTEPGIGANELDGIVRTASGVAASREKEAAPPEMSLPGSDLTACPPTGIPAGYQSAWRLTGTIVAMPGYLDYLGSRLGRAGGSCSFGVRVGSFAEAAAVVPTARAIVNCTGTGAAALAGDEDVTPVRGQVVLAANPGITEFFVGSSRADPGDLTYLFPHGDTVVLGGTQQHGDASREPDPATAARIIAACTAIEPALAGVQVLGHRVGLRPARSRVRLETDDSGPVPVVHNYGHGGAGVTLAWGSAQDATQLVLALLG